ncbi:MAG: UDP-N-acetylmuramoyl-L-alanine--D-glutamate ligase [Oscillospiraceae bacterium]|nr:UDP-N-acetylmuramoyl-L-alanine--D-glutamate ligase [Oscillospiraceae bacterium]
MNLQDYLMTLKDKRIAVLGIGVSNTPLIRLLREHGVAVTACDKKERTALGKTAEELEAMGADLKLGSDYLKDIDADVIFRTPGMRPDLPELLAAKERGSRITSEMQVFFEVCPCPIIAVTGSDGKSTTTTVITEFLRAAGRTVHLGGNIGHPLLAEAGEMHADDVAVLELSSFQLLDMTHSPHIAVLTNLAPNHLDVHRSMEEYIAAKENIFRYQSADDIAIFNRDNAITLGLSEKANGRVRLFSRQQEVADGAFVRDGAIWLRRGEEEREIVKTDEIRIPGQHNVENYLAAIAAVDGLVSDEVIRTVAREFAGVEHRIELVRTRRGVRWYNDSIATSPTRTIAGLHSFSQKLILIAGGYDKHIPFDVLGPELVAHVKLLILCGATANQIRACVTGCADYHGEPEMIECATLDEAVKLAAERAQEGDVVTLSPACAAFDQFPNFMVRGRYFKDLVNALEE